MATEDAEAAMAQSIQRDEDTKAKSIAKYKVGKDVNYKVASLKRIVLILQGIKDKKLRSKMQKIQQQFKDIATTAAQSEMLLHEERGYLEAEGMEKTFRITQSQLQNEVDITTAQKVSS